MNQTSTLVSMAARRPWQTLALFLLFIALLAGGLGRLSFSNDIRVFFDQDNPQLQAYEALENVYSKTNSVLFVVEPADGIVFSRATLNSIIELTEKAWQLPYVRRVDSITNFQYSHAQGDDLIVEDLVYAADELTDADLEKTRRIALNEPLLVNRLISPAADVAAVNAIISLPGDNPVIETPAVAQAARALAAQIMQQNPALRIHLSGLIMINNALGEEGEKDVATLIPLMLALVFLFIWIVFRSVAATLATLLVFLVAVIGAHGVAGWLQIRLSPPVLSAANIILTLAIADSIHVLGSYFHLLRDKPDKRQAMAESLRINHWPVTLTSLTTAIGFLTMLGSESPPFRDLGVIVAAGILLAWLGSLLLLPALMLLLPHKTSAPLPGAIEDLMARLSRWVIKRSRWVL